MKLWHLPLIALVATMTSRDSIAQPDAGAGPDAGATKLTIPPRVEESDIPMFDAEPFPQEKSKAPTPSEWTAAPRVRLTRMSRGVGCTAKRVREWVKIRCDRQTAGLRLIAGSTAGIELWVAEVIPGENAFASIGRFSEIVFPVRQGDRRVFEVVMIELGFYEGWGTDSAFLIEEEWLEGGAPQIAMLSR
jgi:hypothetical protein